MRKLLVLLLVVGFLIGALSVVEELCEESSLEQVDFSDGEESTNNYGDPAPCGGGGTGGGGGQPG